MFGGGVGFACGVFFTADPSTAVLWTFAQRQRLGDWGWVEEEKALILRKIFRKILEKEPGDQGI